MVSLPTPGERITLRGHGFEIPTKQQIMNATKEKLARQLRWVTSTPNAQGLSNQGNGGGERSAIAELGKETLIHGDNATTSGLIDAKAAIKQLSSRPTAVIEV
ncbi:hypothetical protein F4821DRAFT_259647 [Hypoxylon rubiginosum]|uniref:Uncharacterized protein n=1 Tax=Hypoxylon rubiginosum TaxID=110542 RepID=A0ACC0D2Z6_9PEZI|nr:hypothetical protein F4821DRAFT_259647 [Hypoxylon rubiginosum]